MGDSFATVALLGLVLDATGSPLAATGIFVSGSLPALLLMPLAGPLADRFDRQRLMVLISAVQVVTAGSFLFVTQEMVWLAFAGHAAVAALATFFLPACQAAVPNLVARDDLPTATMLMSATSGAMLAIGAGIGGAFTVAFGRTASFVADSVSFMIAAVLIASVGRSMTRDFDGRTASNRIRPLCDTVEGLRYARGHTTVLPLIVAKAALGLSAGVMGLLPVFAAHVFNAGDAGTGVLLAARGLADVTGPLVVRRVVQGGVRSIVMACGVGIVLFGSGYALVAVSRALALAAVGVSVAHVGGGALWALSTYGLQTTTSDELRGRIFATDRALVTVTMSCSMLAAGFAAERVGPGPVAARLGATAILSGTGYVASTRHIRRAPPADLSLLE